MRAFLTSAGVNGRHFAGQAALKEPTWQRAGPPLR
jgi:hypothetical protein